MAKKLKKSSMNLIDQQKIAEIKAINIHIHEKGVISSNEILEHIEKRQKQTKFKSITSMIKEIEDHFEQIIEADPSIEDLALFQKFIQDRGIMGEEYWFCPEDNFYDEILNSVHADDVIYDIGAGDLRLDLQLSQKVKRVYAVEINPTLVTKSLEIAGYSLPKNLIVIVGNAFDISIPEDVTIILSLMIKREHEFTESMKKRKIIFAIENNLNTFEPNLKK